MTTISAQMIEDSISPDSIRLSSMLLVYPRWIHAEVMTHRLLSRNAASSRAIPVERLIAEARDNPATPLYWGKNQKGMQAGEELTGDVLEIAKRVWDLARMDAIGSARALVEVGAHKQLVNRLLEPFTHIRVLVSATDWANFLHLRDHPDAEPHIQILAREVRKCLYQGKPTLLQPGQWHLPYVLPAERQGLKHEDQLTVSAARCASLSYRTVDGHQMTVERALALREKLVGSPVHASPFEHQATPDERTGGDWWAHPEEHGNFRGWRQYRKQIPQEAVW